MPGVKAGICPVVIMLCALGLGACTSQETRGHPPSTWNDVEAINDPYRPMNVESR